MPFPRQQDRTIVEAIIEVMQGSPGPQTVDEIYSKIIDAGLYAFKAAEPKSVVRSQLRRHCVGLDFPTASPVKFFRLEGDDKYQLESAEGVRTTPKPRPTKSGARVPEEIINDAFDEHLSNLRTELKQKIFESHPAFFEQLVIELLIRMGYGGGDPSLGIHTGGPDDEGIDGFIKEDKLGLGMIYLQAKRYAADRLVRRTQVQQFAGAMNRVTKGVIITTSDFAKNAIVWAAQHEKTISLINGDTLADLMIAHGIGVTTVKNYEMRKLDLDYFTPSE